MLLPKSNGQIVTICGSTKYFEEAMEANLQLTKLGWCVFQCGKWGHSYHSYLPDAPTDEAVKLLHFHKIAMSSLVVVCTDTSHYVGSSTKAELMFTANLGMQTLLFDGVKWLSSHPLLPTVELQPVPHLTTANSFEEWLKRYYVPRYGDLQLYGE